MGATPGVIKRFGTGLGQRERRGPRRTRVSGVMCDRGCVIDLSPRGMRLSCGRRWHEGQQRRVTLSDGKRSVKLLARCVWCRQEGMFAHAVGLAFDHASEDDEAMLASLARTHAASSDDEG